MNEEKNELDKEFTLEEARDYLVMLGIIDNRVHMETMRRWVRDGELQGRKIYPSNLPKGKWIVTMAELLSFDPGPARGRQGRPPKGAYER